MNVAATDTRIVFHSQSGYAVSNSSFLMCASVGFFTQNGLPSRDKSSSFGLNVVIDHPVEREQQHDQERRRAARRR